MVQSSPNETPLWGEVRFPLGSLSSKVKYRPSHKPGHSFHALPWPLSPGTGQRVIVEKT
jgi:hypothetical protein